MEAKSFVLLESQAQQPGQLKTYVRNACRTCNVGTAPGDQAAFGRRTFESSPRSSAQRRLTVLMHILKAPTRVPRVLVVYKVACLLLLYLLRRN